MTNERISRIVTELTAMYDDLARQAPEEGPALTLQGMKAGWYKDAISALQNLEKSEDELSAWTGDIDVFESHARKHLYQHTPQGR